MYLSSSITTEKNFKIFKIQLKWWPEIQWTLMHDIWKYWTTAVSTLLGLISSVYHDLHYWRSKQRSQIAEPKLFDWSTSPDCTQVTLNQLVMVKKKKKEKKKKKNVHLKLLNRIIRRNVCLSVHPYITRVYQNSLAIFW